MRSDVYINAKPDHLLKKSLLSFFQKVKITDDRKELLTEHILRKITWREDSKRHLDKNPTTAEHFEKIESYIEALNATRKAWLALPLMTREILPEMITEIDCCLLPDEAKSLLPSVFYSDKSKLPEWRLKGLGNLETWGSDLEMIDLLKAMAMQWQNNHFMNFTRRDSSHIGLIAGIAELCTEHGISVSHTPRSHFVQILMLVFPNLTSPRASIKEAVEILRQSDFRMSR
jgi:hypothetical protein